MKKKLLSILLVLAVLLSCTTTFAKSSQPTNSNGKTGYSDISGHWAEKDVKKLTEKNAVPFKDKFVPGKAITRSEFAVMLHHALGIEINYFVAPEIGNYFTDIKKDASYAGAVIDLVTTGIIDDEGKTFNPDGVLSRELMVHYIMNAMKYEMGDSFKYIKIGAPQLKDSDEINPLYSADIAQALYYKLVTGYGKNVFKPKASTSRAEAAKVISNLVNLLETQNANVTVIPAAVMGKDTIEMKISIFNNSKKAVTINHTSGQKFDFVLMDENKKELYVWSADKLFIMAQGSTTIEPGKTVVFSDTLSGDQYTAIKEKVAYLKATITGTSNDFQIKTEGYEARLK